MPSAVCGGVVLISSALNWRPCVRSVTQSPVAMTYSPATTCCRCPTTVTRSRCPPAWTRSTQYPLSRLWNVIRSITPLSFSAMSRRYPTSRRMSNRVATPYREAHAYRCCWARLRRGAGVWPLPDLSADHRFAVRSRPERARRWDVEPLHSRTFLAGRFQSRLSRFALLAPLLLSRAHTLWYSEHLLGVAPVYWALRLAAGPILAYQWWQIILTALNFVAFAYAARRVGCHCVLALLGAYLWAFALVHLEQVKHQQMIPRFWMPLAASYAWSFALDPSIRWLNRMLACTFLQCISCVYTGWFLVGGLAIFLPLAVALRTGGWAETLRFVKENRRRVALIVGLWIALHLAAFVPYMVVNADISRSYKECRRSPADARRLADRPGWNALGRDARPPRR